MTADVESGLTTENSHSAALARQMVLDLLENPLLLPTGGRDSPASVDLATLVLAIFRDLGIREVLLPVTELDNCENIASIAIDRETACDFICALSMRISG